MDENHETVPSFFVHINDKLDKEMKPKTVPEMLEESAETFRQRAEIYGDNYKQFGEVMAVLFPNGVEIKTKDNWNRLGVFIQKISKLTRYVNNWDHGGHDDSLLDDAVYTTMLRELDRDSEEIPF